MGEGETKDVLTDVNLGDYGELIRIIEELGAAKEGGEEAMRTITREMITSLSLSQVVGLNEVLKEKLDENADLQSNENFMTCLVLQSSALSKKAILETRNLLLRLFDSEYLKWVEVDMEWDTNPHFHGKPVDVPYISVTLKEQYYICTPPTVRNCISTIPGALYAPGNEKEHHLAIPLASLLKMEKASEDEEEESLETLGDEIRGIREKLPADKNE